MDFIEKVAERPDAIAFWALLALVLVVLALVYVARGSSVNKTDDNMGKIIGLFGTALDKIGGTLETVQATQKISMTILEKMDAEIRDGDKIKLEMMRILVGVHDRQEATKTEFMTNMAEFRTHDRGAVERYQTLTGIAKRNEAALGLIPVGLQSLASDLGSVKFGIGRLEMALKSVVTAAQVQTELGRVLASLERMERHVEGLQVVSYGSIKEGEESPLPASRKHGGGESATPEADAQGKQGGDANADQPGAGLDIGGVAVVADRSGVPGEVEDRGTASAELYPDGKRADAGSDSGGHTPGAGGISGAAHAYP